MTTPTPWQPPGDAPFGEPYVPPPPTQPHPVAPLGYQQGYPPPVAGVPPYPPYAYAPYPPYGYPPAGYPYGPPRPGTATAAAVLGFVLAGLLILAGGFLVFGGSLAADIEDAAHSSSHIGAELVVDGFVNLLAGGLLIAGGTSLMSRKPSGRGLLFAGNGIVVAASLYWAFRFDVPHASYVVWALIYAALAITSASLAITTAATAWVRGQSPHPGQPA